MQIPVDIRAVMSAATDIEQARNTPLSVSIYLDDTAPGDVQALVRQAFASPSIHARVSLLYLDGRPFAPYDGDDIAVIVAGLNTEVGRYASLLRDVGVPTMVVTSLPSLVAEIAEASGYPLLAGDLLGPELEAGEWVLMCEKATNTLRARMQTSRSEQERFEHNQPQNAENAKSIKTTTARLYTPELRGKHQATPPAERGVKAVLDNVRVPKLFTSRRASTSMQEDAQHFSTHVLIEDAYGNTRATRSAASDKNQDPSASADQTPLEEPIVLTEGLSSVLLQRMGAWVVEVASDKALAFALAFPFVRKPLALESVRSTSLQNAGVGLLVFIPGADMPIMTLNQAKMLLMIAAAYGEELGPARVKELAAVVGGAFACRALARQLVSFVPGLGWAIKAAIGFSGTQAMGLAAIEYFEGGPTMVKLSETLAQARNRAIQLAALQVQKKAHDAGSSVVRVAAGTVAKVASGPLVSDK